MIIDFRSEDEKVIRVIAAVFVGIVVLLGLLFAVLAVVRA